MFPFSHGAELQLVLPLSLSLTHTHTHTHMQPRKNVDTSAHTGTHNHRFTPIAVCGCFHPDPETGAESRAGAAGCHHCPGDFEGGGADGAAGNVSRVQG